MLKGIGGEAVFTVSTAGLSAVVQSCGEPFSSKDPKLISEWILTHQAVVDFAWERFATVLPFSFDTIVIEKDGKSARENLLAWLEKEAIALREKLARLEGKAEYGVQISWDPLRIAPRITQRDANFQLLEAKIQAAPPGTAYLLKQQLEALLKERLEIAADAYFKEFYQKIKECTEEVKVEKTKKEEAPRQMLANLSCLAPKESIARLGDQLDKIGKIDGFFVRFTGPWPPYSFVNL